MLNVKKEGVILEKTNLDFEGHGVLNPAVIRNQDGIHIFYRAVAEGNISSIGYGRLSDPLTLEYRSETPILSPGLEYESIGMEDPRLVQIDDLYYLSYTAYDGINAMGALALSKDLISFERAGIIVPQITYDEFSHLASANVEVNEKYTRYNERGRVLEKHGKKVFVWDKNVIFFPRRINGKLYFIHRVRPDIQLVAINDLVDLSSVFWQNYFFHLEENIVLTPKYPHEVSYIGGGCPPIETEQGWLLIYHGVHDTIDGYVYCACAALLDLENPQKEIARLPYPLFRPEFDWELKGEVNNVCFPTGTLLEDDILYIYYGAADERIACASLSLSALIKELLLNTKKQ